MNDNIIRAAVIGVGSMGQNHARVLNDMSGVELVGIADASDKSAAAVGNRFRIPFYTDYKQLLAEKAPNAVIVSAPTSYHCEITTHALSKKMHVLVEKPIAFTVEEAKKMIRCAEEHGVLLGVGHIERFNPAILEMKRRLQKGELGRMFMIHSKRQSPLPRRIVDVGVGMDLATHELDMMRFITGSDVKHLSAEVSQVTKAKIREDIIFALLRFNSDVLGVLDVNWVTPTQVREIVVTGEKGMFVANYHTQELSFFENPAVLTTEEGTNWETDREFFVDAGNMIKFQMLKREPLRLQLEAFMQAVRDGAAQAPCSGQDGLEALELALQIVTSGRASRISAPS